MTQGKGMATRERDHQHERQPLLPLNQTYKKINKNVEASVRIGYNTDIAIETAKKTIRKKLEEETEILHDKLDKLLDF